MPTPQQLPSDLADFCDRETHLSMVRDHLLDLQYPARRSVRHFCFFGQGGIGKTALAVHIAHSVKNAFPDGQLYVDLRGALSSSAVPLDVLGEFLRALGVGGRQIPRDLQEAVALYRSTVSGRSLLVVLDNAEDEKQVRSLLPTNPESATIITSRRRLSALEGVTHLQLDVLSDHDSRLLFAQVVAGSRLSDDPRALDLLVRYAAGLPLAIRICGARLSARPDWHVRRLTDLLEDESGRLGYLKVGDLEVEASILASYNDLPLDSRRNLRLLSLMEGTQFYAWTAAALFDVSINAARDILDELVDSQLLAADGADSNGIEAYRLHDLVRVFLRARLKEEDRESGPEALTRIMWTYLFLVKQANKDLEAVDLLEDLSIPDDFDTRRYKPNSIIFPDASTWLSTERESMVGLLVQGVEFGAFQSTWRLARALSPFFDTHAYWSDWEKTHILALDAAFRLNETRPTALVRRGLGRLYEETSRWAESVQQIESAMMGLRNDEDAELYASCLRILGDLHRDQGRFADAIDAYERALVVFESSQNKYWSAVLLRSLGDAHRDFGQWPQAVMYLDAARSVFTELSADRWTAAVSRSLGTVYRDRGPYAQALDVFEEALPVFSRVGDRSLEAQTLQGIGDTYRNMGRLDEAFVHLERARSILTELGDMRRAAVAMRSLADIRRRALDFDQAASLLEECAVIFERLGDYRWGLYTRRTRGLLLLDQGDSENALAVLEECYNAFVALGDERWRANCLRCMGDVYIARGLYEQARSVLLDCVSVFERVEERRWRGKSYRSLGRVSLVLQDRAGAIEYCTRALEIFREIDALADIRDAEDELHTLLLSNGPKTAP